MTKLSKHSNRAQALKSHLQESQKGGLQSWIRLKASFFSIVMLASSVCIPNAFSETYPIRTESAQVLFERGIFLRENGSLEEAEWHIKRALEFEPANADYRFELANVYAIKYDRVGKRRVRDGNKAMLEYAARELEQVVMLTPDFFPARFNLGVVRKKQGRYEEAREEFKRVLQNDPNIVNAHLQIAATYEDQGFFDDARDAYLRAQQLDYGNVEIRESLDDLKKLEVADRERQLAEQSRSAVYGSRFQFSEHSKAREYQDIRYDSYNSQNSIQQAVPYLTMWLVDQFMKMKSGE